LAADSPPSTTFTDTTGAFWPRTEEAASAMLEQNAIVNPDLIIWSASMKAHVRRGEALLIHPVQSNVLRGPSRLICPLA
jgi:hypothetical protein